MLVLQNYIFHKCNGIRYTLSAGFAIKNELSIAFTGFFRGSVWISSLIGQVYKTMQNIVYTQSSSNTRGCGTVLVNSLYCIHHIL